MLGIDLAGGAFIFLAFVVLYTIAVVYSLYSRTGSGINQRSYGKLYGGAPGARRASKMGGCPDRDISGWSRGTR
jgi:hypothetical protein